MGPERGREYLYNVPKEGQLKTISGIITLSPPRHGSGSIIPVYVPFAPLLCVEAWIGFHPLWASLDLELTLTVYTTMRSPDMTSRTEDPSANHRLARFNSRL